MAAKKTKSGRSSKQAAAAAAAACKNSIKKQTKKKSKQQQEEEEEVDNFVIKDNKDEVSGNSSEDDSSHGNDNGGDSDQDETEGANAFTDDNAKWLKPKSKTNTKKSQLLSSSSDEDDDDEDEDDDNKFDNKKGSDDDDDDDDDELLEVERQAQQLDDELEQEKIEAAAELKRTIEEETAIYHLPTRSEWTEASEDRLVAPSELRSHIASILEVLAEFKARREPGRSRSEYVDWLVQFASELYGYIPELVAYFCTMFSPTEAVEFLDASDRPRPLVIRTNTLKARRKDLAAALMKRGVTLDPLAQWSKVGLKIVESPVPIGATPEYLSGHYMLQSAASMCPVLALNPQPKERVLDVSAAPGGKTSYIAQLMRNTGVIVANDLKAERQKATVANLHRLGVHNCVSCTHDGRQLGKYYPNRFDRILLDAPCSGLGVISRDPSVKVQRTVEDLRNCAHLQKELLLAAIDALKVYKPGHSGDMNKDGSGTMVYSTCSVSVFENEEVVNYALSKRDIKIVDTGLEFGKPGFVRYQQKRFHPSVALTRRFYPHVHNMDGFYVAKIIKLSDARPEDTFEVDNEEEEAELAAAEGSTHKKKKESTNAVEIQKKKGKKILRKRKAGAGGSNAVEDSNEAAARKKCKPKLSVPPKAQLQQKMQSNELKQKTSNNKTNAKVTKPRRKRAAADA